MKASTQALCRTVSLLLALTALCLPWMASAVLAHPLGNFSVNRYARLEPTAAGLWIHYVLDMAEISTFQETVALRRPGTAWIDDDALGTYAAEKAEEIRRNLVLTLNRQSVALETRDLRAAFLDGQGGLATLRLEVLFATPPLQGSDFNVVFRDQNDPARAGWREIVVRAGAGATIGAATVPEDDLSDGLKRYPDDLLSNPLDVREAAFSVHVAPEVAAPPRVLIAALGSAIRPAGSFDSLATASGAGALAVALAVAAGLGMAHALSPGHGKTIVAAYLVGSRGTVRHALLLGLIVTATHTAGVYALGLVTLFGSAFLLPEQLYPWISLASGLLVVGVGLSMLLRRLSSLHRGRDGHQGHHDHHGHNHHDYAPSGEGRSGPGWRTLVTLGVSGGLLPCPSALVLMLSAIALQRAAFGLALVVAFSAGLAGVLIATGLIVVLAGRGLVAARRRLPLPQTVPVALRVLPALSSLVVVAAGLIIAAEGLGRL